MQVDLNKYNIINWLNTFKKITLKTRIVKMDSNLIDFINQDGILIHDKYEINEVNNNYNINDINIDDNNNNNNNNKKNDNDYIDNYNNDLSE